MPQDVSSLLEISYYLAFLNYVLGSALLGSPIPFASVKRLGASMMKDSITGIVMVTGFGIILYIVRFIQNLLGADPNELIKWFNTFFLSISSKILFLKTLASISNPLLRSLIDPLISSAISLLTTSFISLFLLRILYILIFEKGGILLAIGVLLYNIPLGIFKRAGSLLMSFVIISMIALPAMPSFANYLFGNLVNTSNSNNQSQNNINTQIVYPLIIFKDYSGNNLSYVYTKFFFPEDPNKIIAAYPADREGVLDTRSLDAGLPADRRIGFRNELYGWAFYTDETLYFSRDCIYTQCVKIIKIPHILVSYMPYIFVHTPSHMLYYRYTIYINDDKGLISLDMTFETKDELMITAPSTTNITKIIINNIETSPITIKWEWAGLEGYTYKISVDPGASFSNIHIDIYFLFREPPKPNLEIIRYEPEDQVNIQLDQFLSDVIMTMILTTIFPAIYVSLITLGANSLSRILSGRH
ncbi:MAG: hypothetical protein GU359_03670 [Desulfurococcales archaeon]|jgi:hypothetical protein|nr:hypothetical protein [Desulfurococcales archaeon]